MIPVPGPWGDFDRYCEEHNVSTEDTPAAFAQWLTTLTSQPVIGRELHGDDLVIALPDDEDKKGI